MGGGDPGRHEYHVDMGGITRVSLPPTAKDGEGTITALGSGITEDPAPISNFSWFRLLLAKVLWAGSHRAGSCKETRALVGQT